MNQNIQIPPDNPFLNCKLGREQYAEVLTDIVNENSEGFVLAIDNKWGTGKSTFVSMWSQLLQNKGFQTLNFNAWENDFENNPFVAITAELQVLLKNENSEAFKEVIKKASVISKNVLPSIMKALLKRYTGEEVAEIFQKYSEGVFEAFQEDIDTYIERKKNIIEFHLELETYISQNSDGKPIVFIIDELDRCRPDYAVSVLENVKHLFSVKGIVFVLAIDKEQLGHAICGAYGSKKIDSNEYLRRFIDIEYTLPRPDSSSYFNFLYEKLFFTDHFDKPERIGNIILHLEKQNFQETSKFLISHFDLTLRQQEKLMIHTKVVLGSIPSKNYIIPDLLIYLVIIRIFNPEFYFKIRNQQLNHDDLLTENKKFVTSRPDNYSYNLNRLINLEAKLIVMYDNYLAKPIHIQYNTNNITTFNELSLKSQFDSSENQAIFFQCIQNFANQDNLGSASIEYLLKKIDLTDSIQ